MFTTSIKSLVAKSLKEVIADRQAKYDEQCEVIEKEALTQKFLAQQEAVDSIIGKFK